MKTNQENTITLESLKAPSVQYMMVNEDSVLLQFSKGMANLEKEIPADLQTHYKIYSATKTFTAIALLQLQESGKLNIEDKVGKYLPEYPALKEISIRELLSHQSGIKNPIPLNWIHLQTENSSFDEAGFIDEVIRKNPPTGTPGKKFTYSNINYLVLSKIIEKVSGLTYEEYIHQHLISKVPGHTYLGFKNPSMNNVTGYQKRGFYAFFLGFLLDKKKYMYQANKEYLGFHPLYVNGKAYGGLITSPERLASYLQCLLNDNSEILSKESKDELFKEQTTINNKKTGMALGWFTGELNGYRYVCHAGGGGGFYCEIRIYPDLKIASLLMMNLTGFTDERLLDKIDQPLLPGMQN